MCWGAQGLPQLYQGEDSFVKSAQHPVEAVQPPCTGVVAVDACSRQVPSRPGWRNRAQPGVTAALRREAAHWR
jgi:hypothetical protein